ncbi:MAG: hypothetical protein AABM31_09185 [Actinomycetota bacterium]
MPKKHMSPRLLVCALLAATAALLTPSAASASTGQLSLIQDDRELFGLAGEDPAAVMAEMKAIGVDVVRTNVIFYKVYDKPSQRKRPGGFNPADPNSAQYDWSGTDRLVQLARTNGIKVLMTVTGPGPHWSSTRVSKCRSVPCTYLPNTKVFGQFAAAVAKRYKGFVDYYSIYNEPNLEVWLTPQIKRSGGARVELAGLHYRKLFQAAYKSIARFDGARRNRVLIGEIAAISNPLPFLNAALCLDPSGLPFSGPAKRAAGCKAGRLNAGGFAIHPYNFGGYGTPRSKTSNRNALSIAYMPRLHTLSANAVRRKRIPSRGRGVYITEFGFQTRPPDRLSRITPAKQAQYINESDRLTYGDSKVKMVGQYELVDVPFQDQFNSGLRFPRNRGGARKPSYDAYRVALVVTRKSASAVEVYGQVRPVGAATVAIQTARGNGQFATAATVRTNSRGFFRRTVRRRASGSRWRLTTQNAATGELLTSRTANPGKELRYYKR